MSDLEASLEQQQSYYRAVAGEYRDHSIDVPGQAELRAAIDAFRPSGDVLELACGDGLWTEHLLESARTVTAVDGSPEMLDLARHRVGANLAVRFIEADLFAWQPDRTYNAVFFGFWISHVPDEQFDPFWSAVATALEPTGAVFFCDDNHRTEAELIEGTESPIVERRLNDGSRYRVVKVPHQPTALESRLRAMGWDIAVHPTSGPFYWGSGHPPSS